MQARDTPAHGKPGPVRPRCIRKLRVYLGRVGGSVPSQTFLTSPPQRAKREGEVRNNNSTPRPTQNQSQKQKSRSKSKPSPSTWRSCGTRPAGRPPSPPPSPKPPSPPCPPPSTPAKTATTTPPARNTLDPWHNTLYRCRWRSRQAPFQVNGVADSLRTWEETCRSGSTRTRPDPVAQRHGPHRQGGRQRPGIGTPSSSSPRSTCRTGHRVHRLSGRIAPLRNTLTPAAGKRGPNGTRSRLPVCEGRTGRVAIGR
jgi:hypothetical protein